VSSPERVREVLGERDREVRVVVGSSDTVGGGVVALGRTGVVRTGVRAGVYFLIGGGGSGLGVIVLGVVLITGEGSGDGATDGIGDATSLKSDDTGAGGGMSLSADRVAHSTRPPASSTTPASTPASTPLDGPLGSTVDTGGGGPPGPFQATGPVPGQFGGGPGWPSGPG
jgi:hypothetical protein